MDESMCSTMLRQQYRIGAFCIVHCKSGWLRFWVSERGRPNFKECTSGRTGISIFIPGSWYAQTFTTHAIPLTYCVTVLQVMLQARCATQDEVISSLCECVK